jgi:hypothetical protein
MLAWFLLLSACASLTTPPPPTSLGPTITPNPFASVSPTPFQPVGEAFTVTALPPAVLPSDTPIPSEIPAPPTPTATIQASPTDTPTGPSPTAIPAARTQIYLNAFLDYQAHAVSVGEAIVYPNMTGVTLGSLVLAVEPNLWPGGFALDALTVDGAAATGFTITAGRLEVPLAVPLAPGATVTLSMNYRLVLPYAGSANVYGYNSLQANLLDWYPFIVPYDPAQGWLLHAPSIVGEHLVYDVADFDVTLQLSDTSLVVAASAPAEWTAQGWHYHLSGRTFVLSVSDSYQIASTAAGSVIVTGYFFSGDAGAANALLQEVAKAVVTYGTYFAPAPYQTLAIVEAATYPDGMEADGMFFLGRKFYQEYNNTVRDDLITIGVHEAAHEWWFGLVGNDQAMEPWLDETLALYSEHVFYEVNYPAYVNWWWGFRVNTFHPTGWVDNTIYNAGTFRPYVNAVYLHGADFMDALRLRIGDEAFFAFLRDYAAQMSGRRATGDDFFRILRTHTSVDFSDIEAAYFQFPR